VIDREEHVRSMIASRRGLVAGLRVPRRKDDAEGGCGVIGMAASVPVAGRHLLQALIQMRNRGNGKGGGIAAVGLDPGFLGVPPGLLRDDYLLAVALLDGSARADVERDFIAPTYLVDHAFDVAHLSDHRALPGLGIPPPEVACYLLRVRPEVRGALRAQNGFGDAPDRVLDDEIVFQNSYRLNRALYASTGEKRAFVLSHGKDLIVLKMVGYGDDVIRYYRLEDLHAHVWIGHHRYPTKGRVWHPGGAHPFIGLHEALVHNGDFANYASIAATLSQANLHPLFLTDTEVAVLMFDLLHRTYDYPLEYVIEAMAPTTERDFTLLPEEKQRVYRMLQEIHVHGSPDGPWFFLVAGSDPVTCACRLVGITDTSMLRPQVFALQCGEAAVGLAASERQGIDAALESLSAEDPRFWPQPDMVWNARGGSHTDGGAFVFTIERDTAGGGELVCTDKFGRRIEPTRGKRPPRRGPTSLTSLAAAARVVVADVPAEELTTTALAALRTWTYARLEEFLDALVVSASNGGRRRAIGVLTGLRDRRVPTGMMKRSAVVALVDAALERVLAAVRREPGGGYLMGCADGALPAPGSAEDTLILDARGFAIEGEGSLARALVAAAELGFTRIVVFGARGHRFIACGLGARGVHPRIDVYGSSGDYLGSGIDGAEVVVHGSAQDQLAQIMKDGMLVVHGDVGQTFGYAAKGGKAYVLGNAAGRPLINAVGKPRVVINGTCLDYLAESFMAGDPLDGGGFVVVNGVRFDEDGRLVEMDTPYPGGNLFSLASGGAIYIRDPHRRVGDDQLNGGAFTASTAADWEIVHPILEENERLFGIRIEALLSMDGCRRDAGEVYRKIAPSGHKSLAPEEAWVAHR
jgi:glutamate synthase domain-containing protein 1/glutamate synthase domain-containing protein 3